MVEVLKPEYGGPAKPHFDETLIQPQEDLKDGYKPPEGKVTPPPEPEKLKPKPSKPVAVETPKPSAPPEPAAVPTPPPEPEPEPVVTLQEPEKPNPPAPGTPVLPGRPIAERLAAYTEGDAKVAALLKIRSDVNALEKEAEARKQELLEFYRSAPADERHTAVFKAKAQPLMDQSKAAKKAWEDASAAARGKALEVLTVPADQRMKIVASENTAADPFGKLKDNRKAVIRESIEFVQPLLAKGSAAEHPVKFGNHPGRRAGCEDYKAGRALYTVYVPKTVETKTVVHEIAHSFENLHAHDTAKEFLDYRCADEKGLEMHRLFPGAGFEKDEIGRKDDFGKLWPDKRNRQYYAGKIYKSGATELFSLGLEQLYEDPFVFAERDPEYLKFVLGMLDGSIR